jgi:hypothetical protein
VASNVRASRVLPRLHRCGRNLPLHRDLIGHVLTRVRHARRCDDRVPAPCASEIGRSSYDNWRCTEVNCPRPRNSKETSFTEVPSQQFSACGSRLACVRCRCDSTEVGVQHHQWSFRRSCRWESNCQWTCMTANRNAVLMPNSSTPFTACRALSICHRDGNANPGISNVVMVARE